MSGPRPQKNRLRVRIPLGFEAEGEGNAAVLSVAGLCALFLLLIFFAA